MEQHQLIASICFAVAIFDVMLVPVISKKAKGQSKPIIMMSMFSGSAITGALGLAFWFQWIKL